MIGKAKSIAHTGKALGYAETKTQAQEIDRNYVIGADFKDIKQEFAVLQSLNTHCEKNTLAFVVSPTIEDGKKLSQQDWKEISQAFLQKMNLSEHQSVTYLHHDKQHKHLHIYVNRIGFDGKAYKDSYLSNRSAQAAKEIAQECGLTRAQDVMVEQQQALRPVSERILKTHQAVLATAPVKVASYALLMRLRGVETYLKHDKQGNLVGVTYELEGQRIKASDIDRSLTGKRLADTLLTNAQTINQAREVAQQEQERQRLAQEKQAKLEKERIEKIEREKQEKLAQQPKQAPLQEPKLSPTPEVPKKQPTQTHKPSKGPRLG